MSLLRYGLIGFMTVSCTVAYAECGHTGLATTEQTITGGPEAFLLQRSLVSLEYLQSDQVDGDLGPISRNAIIEFADDTGLISDGTATPEILKAIHAKGQETGRPVWFSPEPDVNHIWPSFRPEIRSEHGRCQLLLEQEDSKASLAIDVPLFSQTSVVPERTCRLAQLTDGIPFYQHLGNDLIIVWVEFSGISDGSRYTLIGVSHDGAHAYVPRVPQKNYMSSPLGSPAEFGVYGGLETKPYLEQYDSILEQSGLRHFIAHVHPQDAYSLTRFHRWGRGCE